MNEGALPTMTERTTRAATPPALRRERSLRANFSWTFLGNVIYAGCQWGMLVLLAKLGSPEIVGHFALGLALTAPVIMFTSLQLRGIQATDARRAYQFGDYFALRLVGTVLALVMIAGIVLVSGYDRETALVVLIVGLAKGFESVSDVFYGLLQQHERMDRIAISMIAKGVLSLVALGGILFLTGSLIASVIGLTVVWAVILAVYDVPSGFLMFHGAPKTEGEKPARLLAPRWSAATLGKLTWLAMPLGVVMLLNSLNTNIPRYFIEQQRGARELGIFAALSYLMVAGTTVVNALGQAVAPRLSQYWVAEDRTAFRALILKLIGVGLLLGLASLAVAVIAGRTFLMLLYRPEYAEHFAVFFWIVVAVCIEYLASFLGYVMTAAWYFRAQAPMYIAVSGAMLLSCAFLIPRFGLLGAAYATVIAMTIHLIVASGIVLHALTHQPGRQTV